MRLDERRPVGGVATDLPIIRPGVDVLPATCSAGHCGPHDAAPPLGADRFGTITCRACGRMVAWVEALPRFVPRVDAVAPRRRTLAGTRAATAPKPWRVPGCAPACVDGRHSAEAHEEYGRRLALSEIEQRANRPTGVIRTGPLVVDFDAYAVYVHGTPAPLTHTEQRIVMHLSTLLGVAVPYAELSDVVWGRAQTQVWQSHHPGKHDAWHVVRVNIARSRGHLGEAAGLLESVTGRGRVRLRAVAPEDCT